MHLNCLACLQTFHKLLLRKITEHNKVWNIPGDKLHQHVMATDHSLCAGWATVAATHCGDTWQRQITSCVQENFHENLCFCNRSLSLKQVAKNQIRLNLCHLLWRQNFVADAKIFIKIFQYTRGGLSLRHVAATCWCNFLPSVYQP